jgi:hypothetical protein
MTPATKATSKSAITRPINAIVIPFDDTEHLPADMEIQFFGGSRMSVEAISQIDDHLYPDMVIFRGRFGTPGYEFIVDIKVANALLEKISRQKGGARV